VPVKLAFPVKDNPAKAGVAVEEMPWIVLTAPAATEKLVELKEAMPLAAVVASAIEPVRALVLRVNVRGAVPVALVRRLA